jgi:MbtH protein
VGAALAEIASMGGEFGTGLFRVVKNAQGQYALIPLQLPIPPGWEDAGRTGTSEECQAFVNERWTDMRPSRVKERK